MNSRSIKLLVIGALFLGVMKVATERRNERRAAEIQAQIDAEREHAAKILSLHSPTQPALRQRKWRNSPRCLIRWAKCSACGDTNTVTQVFDPERMIAEMERIGLSKLLTLNQAQAFKEGVRMGARAAGQDVGEESTASLESHRHSTGTLVGKPG